MVGSATQFEQFKQFQQQQWQQMKEFQAMQANQSNAYASPENFYERDNVTHSNVHRNVNNSYPHINHSACPNKINHLQRHKMEHKPNHPFPFHPSANYPRSEHQFHQSRRSEAYDAQREVKQHPQREVPEIKFNLDTLQNVLKLFNIQPNDNSQPKPAPQTRKGNAHVVRPSSPAASSCDTKAKANAHNEHPCARLFQRFQAQTQARAQAQAQAQARAQTQAQAQAHASRTFSQAPARPDAAKSHKNTNPHKGEKAESPEVQNFKRLEEYSKSVEAVMNSDKAKNVKEAELMRILLGIDGIDCSPLLRPLRKALATQINQELEALDNLAKEIPESAGDVNEVNVHTEEEPIECSTATGDELINEENPTENHFPEVREVGEDSIVEPEEVVDSVTEENNFESDLVTPGNDITPGDAAENTIEKSQNSDTEANPSNNITVGDDNISESNSPTAEVETRTGDDEVSEKPIQIIPEENNAADSGTGDSVSDDTPYDNSGDDWEILQNEIEEEDISCSTIDSSTEESWEDESSDVLEEEDDYTVLIEDVEDEY